MPDFDLLIRGAVDLPAIGISDGRIAALEDGSAVEEIDATGLLALPGVIDSHVHFNEPGRTEWEGVATGSRACAAGGTTTFFDMPLNSSPPVIDAAAFDLKCAAFEENSFVDFALWGGLVPGNLEHLEALHERGVVGLKAFLSDSGIADFPKIDASALRTGMKRAGALGLLVAVHAEIDHPELRRGSSIADYLASRPMAIELEAIRLALDLAGETGCALHIVHVSNAAGVGLVEEAQAHGVDVTCETCPHYLALNEDDLARLGAVAKCAPPLRAESERRTLLNAVIAGKVQTLGSDHSPAPMSMKTDADFFKAWGGISGCQHLLALLLDLGLSPELITSRTAANVADRFGFATRKGRLQPGFDADLVLVALEGSTAVTSESLLYRHRHSPYVGRELRGRVVRTILRGQTIQLDSQLIGEPRGRFLSRRDKATGFRSTPADRAAKRDE
jgi:allantoinase